jgi:3D-(3,5/4)-trihydroxycyclohexane-1,2-dione acylhydrolase (decyclizing)
MGCESRRVATIDELRAAVAWARTTDRTTVIVIETDPHAWTEGGAWWEVGVPESSPRRAIREARAALDEAKQQQRRGI